jgi:transposase
VQRAELKRLTNAPTTPQRLVRRARIVLARAAGRSRQATAIEFGVSRSAVILW